jgi:hypothetical protein
MRSKNVPPRATFQSAWKIVQENAKSIKEMTEREEKAWKEFRESSQTMQKEREMQINDWQKEREIQIDNWQKERDEWHKERMKTDDWMKAMQKEIGGISNSNGAVAESYFINSFANCMQFAGQEYDGIIHNYKQKSKKLKLQGEYDLLLYNCTSVVIIEIKYKAREDDVARLVKKAPTFKQLFPQYANYDLYLGLAALHFEDNTETESLKQGIAVIKQVGDNMVIIDEQLRVF